MSVSSLFHSYARRNIDPVMKYVYEKSNRLQPVHIRLMEMSCNHAHGGMTSSFEAVQLNMNLMKTIGAKKVIEIGTFTGFHAMGAALAIPDDGKVIACDISDDYANLGKPYWEEAGVHHKIVLKIQPALQTLDELIANGETGTFDFAFIDADKENNDNYYEKCLKLVRKGGIIAIDNTLWMGDVAKPEVEDIETKSIRILNDKLLKDTRVNLSLLTIGDGLTLLFVC